MQTSGPSLQRLHFPGFCGICSSLVAFWQPKLAENSVKAVRSTIVNDIGEARCHTEKWDLSSSSRRDSFTYNHRPIRASATARSRSSLLPLKRSHTFPLLTRAPEAFGKTPQPRRNAICSPSVVAWKSVQKSKSDGLNQFSLLPAPWPRDRATLRNPKTPLASARNRQARGANTPKPRRPPSASSIS